MNINKDNNNHNHMGSNNYNTVGSKQMGKDRDKKVNKMDNNKKDNHRSKERCKKQGMDTTNLRASPSLHANHHTTPQANNHKKPDDKYNIYWGVLASD